MKTFYKKIIVLSIILISIMMWTKTWSQSIDIILTVNPSQIETHYICEQEYNQVILYNPSWAISNISWEKGSNEYWQDSIIITPTNQGYWLFNSSQGSIVVYIYFVSGPPMQPSCMAHDTSFCISSINWNLDAENTDANAAYLWDNGSTGQFRLITTVGTYWSKVTTACGTRTDTIHVTQGNPNAPHLGADQTFCWGSTITLDPLSTNVASYLWSTGEITPTITVDTTGSYWIDLVDNNGCNGRDTIHITSLLPIGTPICYVEFDTLTWKNDNHWSSNLPGNADSVIIYKQAGLSWVRIGSVPKTVNHFLDMGSAPQTQSYSYEIAVKDTCGNESSLSAHHKTITLLCAYDQLSNTYGFTWSAYEGIVIDYYYLFAIDASNNVHQIDSVNGNIFMYNYGSPNLTYVKYFIGFKTPDCNAKTNVIVKSNWIHSIATSIHEIVIIPFSVFPNPTNNQLTLNIGVSDFNVKILTMLGQVVLSEQNTKVLNVQNLNRGMYIISITAGDVTTNKTFVKD